MTAPDRINNWMMTDGRSLGDGVRIVESYARLLVAEGVPLDRANIAQLLANPLLAAWGVIWTPASTTEYDVERSVLDTTAYIGGPFEYVLTNRETLHKSLLNLDPRSDHPAYIELAEAGGADLFANMLEYGDGSVQSCTYVSNNPNGFKDEHLELVQATRHGLSSALEPVAMRKSTASLLRSYLGSGPAAAVVEGSIQRGEHTALDAVVMFTDLRGFTHKSETWSETELLKALNGYFDVMVHAVEAHNGDVLKFMGDGILSIFPIGQERNSKSCCRDAMEAARNALAAMVNLNAERMKAGQEMLSVGIGIHRGTVTYGNIGSPHRLDFTVLGSAVNLASRVQDLCKSVGEPVLATGAIADGWPDDFTEKGNHTVRGVSEPIKIFALKV